MSEYERYYKIREQDQRKETEGEIQSLYPSQRIGQESKGTTIVGMNNDNSVDGNMSEMDCTIILQQYIFPKIEIDQYNCTKNINIQSAIEGREYRSNYQREYRNIFHEQMNDIESEYQTLNQSQQERQRSEGEYKI